MTCDDRIFGYDWTDIQHAQQGGRLPRQTIKIGGGTSSDPAPDKRLWIIEAHGGDQIAADEAEATAARDSGYRVRTYVPAPDSRQ
jgi:hypothetical protein